MMRGSINHKFKFAFEHVDNLLVNVVVGRQRGVFGNRPIGESHGIGVDHPASKAGNNFLLFYIFESEFIGHDVSPFRLLSGIQDDAGLKDDVVDAPALFIKKHEHGVGTHEQNHANGEYNCCYFDPCHIDNPQRVIDENEK